MLKIELPYYSSVLLLCVLSEGNDTISKSYPYSHVHCSVIYNSQDMENNSICPSMDQV